MIRPALLVVLAVVLLGGCSTTAEPPFGVVVHGEHVPVHTHAGYSSWHRSGSVWMGLGRQYTHDEWAGMLTHELCHAIDYNSGWPSQAWAGDPDGPWAGRSTEAWAETCSWLWLKREGDPSFVTRPPGTGVDTSNAPWPLTVTRARYSQMCYADPQRLVCPRSEGTVR